MIAEPMSAGARRKPNASALVGMVAAASVSAKMDTTAILPNFSIMTRPSVCSPCLLGGEPALGFVICELTLQTRHELGFRIARLAISRDMVNPRAVGLTQNFPWDRGRQ